MSFKQFRWNTSECREVSERRFSEEERKLNPYLGKHMVKFGDGTVRICEYVIHENGKPRCPDNDEGDEALIEYFWKPVDGSVLIPVHDDDLCYPMSYIFDMLSGIPTPYSCWEFGCALAQFAIPALETWIKKGVSYAGGMTPEQWDEIRSKVLKAFKVSLEEFEEPVDDPEECLARHKRNQEIREEGFSLMARYYMDFWD